VASSSSTLDEAIRTPKKAKANEEKSTDAGSPAYHTQEKNILGPKIRISEERLTTLYEAADDLLSYRMSAGSHLSELKNIAKAMQSWRWTLNRVEGDVAYLKRIYGASSDVLDRVLRFIENTRDMIGNCEIKLDATIKTMFQDHAEMDTAITQLIESIKEVVLVPFSTLIDTFPRMVRDIAHEEGKKVRFSMSGSEIEIDRRILEVIKDPLIHLIRNAVDHGIEPVDIRIREGKAPEGVISIEIAHTRANRINISISDDGRGIDPDLVAAHAVQNGIIREDELESLSPDEKIELIFQSGFTTAPQISRVSGRGLGLAIVLEKTSQVGGTVEVTSIPGKKTCFVLTVPVTLATFSGLMVHVENRPFFLPLRDIERVLILLSLILRR
jgi:two-component system chemotaxis sensor kinase CheA